jgi:RNA polymerase sigma-70 factor (ECF subfamily)
MILDGGGPPDERFENFYRTHYARVWRYFRASRISDDESHDLAQETFKRLWQYWNQIRNEDPAPFVKRISKTILLNHIRAGETRKRGAPTVSIDDPELLFADPAAPPQPDYAEEELREARRKRLRNAMASLPQSQRDCLRLRIQDFTYDEITSILGISLDAVKSRLRDAKRALREQLGENHDRP